VQESIINFNGRERAQNWQLVGTYTQISGNLSRQLGALSLEMSGYYRADGRARDYSIGPSASWRLRTFAGLQLTMLADARKTPTGAAGFVGGRLSLVRGALSTISGGGAAFASRPGASSTRSVGNLSAQWNGRIWDDSQLSLGGGLNRDAGGSSVQGSSGLQHALGTARADLIRRMGGSTAYSLNLQSGGAAGGGGLALGGRELTESALIASVQGRSGTFEVLIDGIPRGRIASGSSLPLFLAPYRNYSVRLRPLDSGAIDFDPAPRTVTLFPGNVEHAVWTAERLTTLFGRLVDPAGQPLEGLRVEGRAEDAVSGADGWFQFDQRSGSAITFVRPDGTPCRVALPRGAGDRPYLSLGTVTCS
jgi:hypothetical protein